jgi:glycosyltransferase involved in cell wall biosynthesis
MWHARYRSSFRLGTVEVIEEGRSGFLVNDVRAGARAVQAVSKIRREECRQRFEERFSATRMAHDYLTVYKRLAGKEPEVLHLGDGVSVG